VLIGRKDSTLGTNSSFESPAHSQFFTADTQAISVTRNDTTETYSGIAHNAEPVTVHYDPVSGKYMLVSGDRVAVHTVEALQDRFYPVDRVEGYQSEYRTSYKTLNYVTGMSWASRILSGSSTQFDFRNFVYGFPTEDASLPKSGTATFGLTLGGTIVDKQYEDYGFTTDLSALVSYSGKGVLRADLGAGTIALDGWLEFLPGYAQLSGAGLISSGANGFSGSLAATGPDNTYDGTFSGRFYGPGAAEAGGTFQADNGPNALFAGYFVGARDEVLAKAFTPWNALTGSSSFDLWSVNDPFYFDKLSIDYNSATGGYVFHDLFFNYPVDVAFGPGDIDPARSDASRIWYEGDPAGSHISGWLNNPAAGNPQIDLTYTRFGEFESYPEPPSSVPRDHHVVFGNATPIDLIPRAGTATYTGIALGTGELPFLGYTGGIHGTSTMAVNFGDWTLTSQLKLFTDEAVPQAIGTFDFDAAFDTYRFTGLVRNYPPNTGSMEATFFGPHAEEFGYIWNIGILENLDPGLARWNNMRGIAVGTKDP